MAKKAKPTTKIATKARAVKDYAVQRIEDFTKPLPSRNPEIDVDALVADINKKFGANAIRRASEVEGGDTRPRVSWGSLVLDYLMGGAAKGRIHTISGDTGTGKSHLTLKIIAWYMRMFPTEVVALINSEDSYEEEFAIEAGIDVDDPRFLLHEPDSHEEALNVARHLQKLGVGLIVVDSMEALASDKDFEKEAGESKQQGIKQKNNNDFTKIITNQNNRARREGRDGTTFFLILQLRDKMGVVFGDPQFEPGGRSLQFMPHNKIRLSESDKEWNTEGKKRLSVKRSTITATVTKSRQIGKGKSTFYYFNQDNPGDPVGIDHHEELIQIGFWEGFITTTEKQNVSILGKVTCKANAIKDTLVKDPELLQELYAKVMLIIFDKMKHTQVREGTEEVEEAGSNDSPRARGRVRTTDSQSPKRKKTGRKR